MKKKDISDVEVSPKAGMRRIAWLWALLILAFFAGGVWFFRAQVVNAENEAITVNAAIARLKVEALARWRGERLGDARVLSKSEFLIRGVNAWIKDPKASDAAKIMARFKAMTVSYKYSDISMVDVRGQMLISLSGARKAFSVEESSALEASLRDHQPVMTDLYLDPATGKPRLDVLAPFYEEVAGKEQATGAFVLTVDPEVTFYPMIREWPVPTRTAETLLVRRDGDSTLWLNNVRFNPEAAFKMRQPLTQTGIPAVQAVLGKEGPFRGTDYRGKKVVSFLARVPDSPWFMVSKIDADEIFSGIRLSIYIYYALLVALLAVAIFSTAALYQRATFFKVLHEKDEVLAIYNRQLAGVNKELEAFSYSVSHDLRAPLRSIDGFSKALLEEYQDKLDETGKDYLSRVWAATVSMGQLIDDLLGLSRVGRLKMDLTREDLSAVASRIAAELKERDPARKAEFLIQPDLVASGDANLIEIALRNLLENAWKFTSKKPSARIEFGTAKVDGREAYFVRDDGAGFDARYYDKLFNPFQRLHSEKDYSGTGIGLVTVKRVIERHGGRVWGESELGKGAIFYFTLHEKGEAV